MQNLVSWKDGSEWCWIERSNFTDIGNKLIKKFNEVKQSLKERVPSRAEIRKALLKPEVVKDKPSKETC
jgi:hypothetical protein